MITSEPKSNLLSPLPRLAQVERERIAPFLAEVARHIGRGKGASIADDVRVILTRSGICEDRLVSEVNSWASAMLNLRIHPDEATKAKTQQYLQSRGIALAPAMLAVDEVLAPYTAPTRPSRPCVAQPTMPDNLVCFRRAVHRISAATPALSPPHNTGATPFETVVSRMGWMMGTATRWSLVIMGKMIVWTLAGMVLLAILPVAALMALVQVATKR